MSDRASPISPPAPLPAAGGSYLRAADGSLRLLAPGESIPGPTPEAAPEVAPAAPPPAPPRKKGA